MIEPKPIADAPRDGTVIIGVYDDGTEDRIQWDDDRRCAGDGPMACQGAGWASLDAGGLPVDEPPLWRPEETIDALRDQVDVNGIDPRVLSMNVIPGDTVRLGSRLFEAGTLGTVRTALFREINPQTPPYVPPHQRFLRWLGGLIKRAWDGLWLVKVVTVETRFPPVGSYRHGVDAPDDDPHRFTPVDQLPRWHPRALEARGAIGEGAINVTLTSQAGTEVISADVDRLPSGIRITFQPGLAMSAGDTLEITSADLRMTGP